jgi:peptide/nickel transport system substrate-binding protein
MSPRGLGDESIPTRRGLLAGGATLCAGALTGCVQRVSGLLDGPDASQFSLSIKTVPADSDEPATRIARALATNLQAAGVDASVVIKQPAELRRDVLQRSDFDLYVDRLPIATSPDDLRPLLHSTYVDWSGWNNPFGFEDSATDAHLVAQRRKTGQARRRAVTSLLQRIAATQPFAPVALPDVVAASRTDRFAGWDGAPLSSPVRYLGLTHVGDEAEPDLAVATTDDRITRNLNPLSALYRERGTVTGLLYEPLGGRVHRGIRPWLARDWSWIDGERGVLEVSLRDALAWHDGTPLTAADVTFTYRFLADTSLGDADVAVPAPRYNGLASLVEDVVPVDETTLRLTVGEAPAAVARRALTVPVLPAHVWSAKTARANPEAGDGTDPLTEAITWPNVEPVGSGPLRVSRRVTEEVLVLERFDDHFLNRAGSEDRPLDGLDYRTLRLQITPAPPAAVDLAVSGDVDGTMALSDPRIVQQIGRDRALSLTVDLAPEIYHVGFNGRREPFDRAAVRRLLVRHLDKAAVATEVFHGYATPLSTPLPGDRWTPETLAWDDGDPVASFLGSDGELDVERARERFRAVGFAYADGVAVAR